MIKKSLKAVTYVMVTWCPRGLVVLMAKLIRKHDRLQRLFDPNEIRKHSSKNFRPKFIKAKGIHGEKLYVDFNDHIGYRYFLLGFFDNVPFEICKKLGFKNLVLIDIGSNIGAVSVPIAINGARVVSIEPQVTLVKQLIHNFEINSLEGFIVLPIALDNVSSGQLRNLSIHSGNNGASSLYSKWNPGMRESISRMVPTYKFDSVVYPFLESEINKGLDFVIKIDVEGFENEVIEGMTKFIRENRPLLILEHRPDLNVLTKWPEELTNQNYSFFGVKLVNGIDGIKKVKLVDFDSNRKYENVLGIPIERKLLFESKFL